MCTILRLPLYITDNLNEFIKKNNLVSFSCVVKNAQKKILYMTMKKSKGEKYA